jgi:amino acid adenylation domain-containing protein
MFNDEPAQTRFALHPSSETPTHQAYDTPDLSDAGVQTEVAAQAERAPDRVVLLSEEQQMTAGALDRRANQLAHSLRALAVGPEVPVGLCLERSPAMIIALLAVLKAGGAYVPLEPDAPPARLAFLLQDAGITVLLTRQHLLPESLPGPLTVICLERDWPQIARCEASPPSGGSSAANLAYIIYTSGSTGTPKGVLVEHRHLRSYLRAVTERLALPAGASFALLQPLTVDSCLTTIFPPLCSGGRLHLLPPAISTDAYALSEYFCRHPIDCLKIAPSHLAALQTSAYGRLVMPRQRLIIGGEASHWNWISQLHHLAPSCMLFNHYGPTETTVGVLTYRVGAEPPPSLTTPLGRPLEATRVYLLDADMQPVPPGTAGELSIGGANLARGYLKRPELVAEKFVPDPFSQLPGERLYRTGDLARTLPDGNLEFLGRVDDQVKVRGFRIELPEIEACLVQHPRVQETLVLCRDDPSGGQRLVAYVIPTCGQSPPSASELRSFLSMRLPEYMLPAAFLTLDALPRTPHGKVDRRALPVPGAARPALAQEYVAPGNDLERFLAGMWQEMLGIDAPGIHDSFFELGGDSIKGAIFTNKLQEYLGEIVYIVTLFDAPTIASLAAYLQEHYRQAVARLPGASPAIDQGVQRTQGITAHHLAILRQHITPLSPHPAPPEKNPAAIFVLAPPRSGTTLLRVMLGLHPALFAPPELGLLSFHTLAERRAAFSGRNSFRLEGTMRAIMELRACDAEAAREIMAAYEAQQLTTAEFYRLLQEWIGTKILVDKTPLYALDTETLRRAERDFAQARYLHLVRHPSGMIHSFVKARLDRIFFWRQHSFAARELAELVWLLCQQNILEFLQEVPARRQHRVCFEELVRQPGAVMEDICRFLDLPFHPAMLEPYKGKGMTDGVYTVSRMMGDATFHEHSAIDPRVADRWQEQGGPDFLGELSWQMAQTLGYTRLPVGEERRQQAARPAITALRPVAREPGREFPLSFPQLRLWFLDQWEPANPSYNMHQALHLAGPLQREVLEQSFQEIVRRHEALRTTFAARAGTPVQVIAPALQLPLTGVDLSVLPEEQREAEAIRWMTSEILRPFDLATGPLLRISLLRLGPEEHMLLLTKHHSISDAWSTTVLFRELTVLYTAFAQGMPSPLPPLPLQYPDFALWQRQWLQGEVLAGHLDYWKRQLAGASHVLALPTDRPRPPVQTYDGARFSFTLAGDLTARLKALSQHEGVTLYITLLAAFQILLWRYSGQEDFLLGTPIANRTRIEIEKLIGFFINTLLMRADLSGDPSGQELLARVRTTAVGAYAHQDLPFEQLVEALSPHRDSSRSPLYQVVFSLQNAPQTVYELPGLSLRPLVLLRQTAKVDLALTLQEAAHGLHGWWEYNVDLFEASTIARMHNHWLTILQGLVTRPEQRLSTLPLLSAQERQQIIMAGNPPAPPTSDDCAIHTLFEAQVARTPDAVALICDDCSLTYQQLNQRANQLALHLQHLGVGPETLVGVYLPRCLDLIIAIFAVLKAGGAYIPLDPAYPSTRLAYTLEDARILLTHRALCEHIPAYQGSVLTLDSEQTCPDVVLPDPHSGVRAGHLAYVIFTSGSTGTPRGVLIQHGGLVARTRALIELYALDASHRQSQFVSPAFDVLGEEIFPTLSCGAQLVLLAGVTHVTPARLLLEYDRLGVSKTNLPASYWHQAVDELTAAGQPLPASFRLSVTGAESPDAEKLRQWAALAQRPFRFFNVYGPTEATILVTSHEIPFSRLAHLQGTALPIGRALPATQVYVLDAQMQPVPPGIKGELCLGGSGLARGYLHQPERTAECFVPHPWSTEPGARLYRTGDLARCSADGTFAFVGRLDRQIKLRGFRIEPGEVEAVLRQHPAIQEAVVLTREDSPGDPRLVAYLVARTPQTLSMDEVRASLQQRLPDYLVPAAFVELAALPLSANSKLDLQALPPPESSQFRQERACVAPRNSTEETLAAIWRQVIGLRQVGVFDNFFTVGGHSLLATRVVARVRSAFQVDIPLRAFFEAPTIAHLGTTILQKLAGHASDETLARLLSELDDLPTPIAAPPGGPGESTAKEDARE